MSGNSGPEHTHDPADPAALIRSSLAGQFDLLDLPVSVHTSSFSILKVRDSNVLVDAINPEEFADDERLPYWADVWTSAYELARHCLSEGSLSGARVLEIGCGVGLAGIAAVRAGAFVTLSDYEHTALRFAEYNALTNLTDAERERVSFMHLDWRSLPAVDPFDVILAADVVYERRNFFPLLDVLQKLMRDDGWAVFTEPGRAIGGYFFSMLQEHGFRVESSGHIVRLGERSHEVIKATIRKPVG